MSELPQRWVKATYGDVIEKISNGIALRQNKIGAGVPVSRIETIANAEIDMSRIGYCDELTQEEAEKYRLREGDILFSHINSDPHLGKAAIYHKNFGTLFHGTNLLRIEAHRSLVDPCFLLRHCQFHRQVGLFSLAAQHAVNQSSINQKKLRALPFYLPPFNEQRRIVAKLDSLFDRTRRAREELSHIPRLIERYKQAILAAAFRDAVETAERNVPLGALASEVRNGLSKKPADTPPGTPILRISAVRPLAVDLLDRRYYPAAEEVPGRAILMNGDLLFTRYNGNPDFVAVCGKVKDLSETMTYPDKLIRVRLVQDIVPSFAELICSAPQVRDALRPFIKTAAGQHGISGRDLKKLPVPVPTPQMQREIDSGARGRLTIIAALTGEYRAAVRLLDHLDQANLRKAFRGELVPQDPNDEPAAALLERIHAAGVAVRNPKRGRRKPAPGAAA